MAMRAIEQDQERLLDEAASVVKEQAFFMRRAIVRHISSWHLNLFFPTVSNACVFSGQ